MNHTNSMKRIEWIMATIITFAFSFLVAAMCLGSADAADFEVSVGESKFASQPNGTWYQNGFAHDLALTSPSLSIGATGYVNDWMRWHSGYMYLGDASSNAIAVSSDAAYAKYGANAGKYWPTSHWYGNGSINMLYATVAPEYKDGDFTFAVEAGFTVYKPTWTMNIPDYIACATCARQNLTVEHSATLQLGETLGFSIKYGNTAIVLSRYTTSASGDMWPAIYTGHTDNISIRHQF